MAELVEALQYKPKAAVSIPDGVFGIFHWNNRSGRNMTLGLTQPLTQMNTSNISCGVKATDAWGWQPYYLHVPIVLKPGSLNLLEPSGPVRPCNGIALPFTLSEQVHCCRTSAVSAWPLLSESISVPQPSPAFTRAPPASELIARIRCSDIQVWHSYWHNLWFCFGKGICDFRLGCGRVFPNNI